MKSYTVSTQPFSDQKCVTHGATLRVYLKSYEPDVAKQSLDPQVALKDLISIADELAHIHKLTGMEKPTLKPFIKLCGTWQRISEE